MNPNPLVEKIIIACYEIHSELGIGFVEKVYENSLTIALRDQNFEASQQSPISVYFRNQIVGSFYADIVVNEEIVLELKAVNNLLPEHQAQLINYLSATRIKTGLLINFAKKGLEIKRCYQRNK